MSITNRIYRWRQRQDRAKVLDQAVRQFMQHAKRCEYHTDQAVHEGQWLLGTVNPSAAAGVNKVYLTLRTDGRICVVPASGNSDYGNSQTYKPRNLPEVYVIPATLRLERLIQD